MKPTTSVATKAQPLLRLPLGSVWCGGLVALVEAGDGGGGDCGGGFVSRAPVGLLSLAEVFLEGGCSV